MEKTFYFLIILYMFVSCNSSKSKKNEKKFSEIFMKVDSIQLESNDNCTLSHGIIDFKILKEKKYFIADVYTVYLFDNNGKFFRKFGNRGNGPTEFSSIASIVITNNKNLLIYDAIRDNVVKADTNLNFIKSKDVGSGFCSSFVAADGNYFFYNRNYFEDSMTVKIYDSSFIYKKSIIDFPYNSVIQVRLAARKLITYAFNIKKLIVANMYDPYLKIYPVDSVNYTYNYQKISLEFPLWKEVTTEKVKKYFPKTSINPKKLGAYLKDKLKIRSIFYLGNNNVLIEYTDFKLKNRYLQILNLFDKSINYFCKGRRFFAPILTKDDFIYFAKYNFNKNELKNPKIIKYKLNNKIFKQKKMSL